MLDFSKNREKPSEEQLDELLSAYLDDVLSVQDRTMVERRLRREPALMARLDSLRRTKKALANLPPVAVPRNFILSPSMVATPKPAPRSRKRRLWPVFGWATAAVTLLFLLVFAGDLFIIKPSLQPELTDAAPRDASFSLQTIPPSAPESVTDVPEAVRASEGEPAEPMAQKVAPADEVPSVAREAQPTIVTESAAEMTEAPAELSEAEGSMPPTPPTAGGGEQPTTTTGGEMVLEAEPLATGDATMVVADEALELQGTPVPEDRATAAVTAQESMVASPPPTAVEESPVAAVPAVEEERSERTLTPQTLAQSASAPPETVGAYAAEAPPLVVDTDQAAVRAPAWLRPLEVGLGLSVIVLSILTVLMRRRGA